MGITFLKKHYKEILNFIKPFKNILYFLFLFFTFEFFWKLCIHESKTGEQLFVLGKDFTYLIYPLCKWTANSCYWIIHNLLGYKNFNISDLLIYFDNSLALKIIWGCTGIKQILQFSFILFFFWGSIKQKCWFIPVSVLLLIFFNLLRLVLTSFVIKDGFPNWFIYFNESFNGKIWDTNNITYWEFYKDWFSFFHDYIFKWVYYDAVIFILWLLWVEKFGKLDISNRSSKS